MRAIKKQSQSFPPRNAFHKKAFDWRPDTTGASVAPGGESYHAPLENGHNLRMWRSDDDDLRGIKGGWFGGHEERPEIPWRSEEEPGQHGINWTAAPNWEAEGKGHNWPTREQAQSAIEDSYRKHYPVGTDTGSHDSGVDYSNLNSFKL